MTKQPRKSGAARSRVIAPVVAGVLLTFASALAAHDLILRARSDFVEPNAPVEIPVLNGTFAESEGPVAQDRVRDISVVGPDGTTHPDTGAWRSRDSEPASQDSAAVAAVIDRFHRALAAGDSAEAAMLLLADAVVLESGGIETREEYLGGHLRGDIAFARAVPRERGPIAVQVYGDVALATSTSVARGEYRDRVVNSAGAELMVLRRTSEGWRIAAIHWSSRQLRA